MIRSVDLTTEEDLWIEVFCKPKVVTAVFKLINPVVHILSCEHCSAASRFTEDHHMKRPRGN